MAQGNCWKKVKFLVLKSELDMLEVGLEQLFWTNILNVVMQNIELIMSARNDELTNLFNWFFNSQYTLQFSYSDGKIGFVQIYIFIFTLLVHVCITA